MSGTLKSTMPLAADEVATRPTCYILKLNLTGFGKIESAECPGIHDAAARQLTEAAAVWRDERFRIRRLAAACSELNLPNLAVVQSIGHKKKLRFDVPPPLTVPFEPIELDETHPALAGMVETLILNDGEVENTDVKKARWLGRAFIRIGAPAILLLNISIQAIVQSLTHYARHGLQFWYIAMWMSIWCITIGACYYAVWRTSAQWILIPGGIVVRRTFWKNVGVRLERYTPADTLLILTPDNIGWVASLYRAARPADRRRLTRLEATALLAAWQSPIPPRPIENMSDLM